VVSRRGTFRPEVGVPAGAYIAEQARVGMEVRETLSSLLGARAP
jgi:hypothetical protein